MADVIILARGGGSLEDLWPFNEEVVARAIYNSQIPIISAVGHETDFTIADFVADLRAPTPSAAAELANPNVYELKEKLHSYNLRARNSLKKKLELMDLKYEKIISSRVFLDPLKIINDNYLKVDSNVKEISNIINSKQMESKMRFSKIVTNLDTLSPLKTLSRGYAIVEMEGKIVKKKNDLKIGDTIELTFEDGKTKATVLK